MMALALFCRTQDGAIAIRWQSAAFAPCFWRHSLRHFDFRYPALVLFAS